MSMSRFLDFWAPPPGYRLASVLATTYQLHADFLEEDLLPLALGLRQSPAKGRGFRIELEQALQDTDVTVYLHPDGYQPGLRRTPRVDLIPLPSVKVPKLHAKVGLLRFVPEGSSELAQQVIRLVVGSANLTVNGYRTNIEVGVAMDDEVGAHPSISTAVRDAAAWLQRTISPDTEQARAQHRHMQAVFQARPVRPVREGMAFVGLPQAGGLLHALNALDLGKVHTLTAASPFWPTGEDLEDVVSTLMEACRGTPDSVRLVGPCREVEGRRYAEMPPSLLRALNGKGVKELEIAYADPEYGSAQRERAPDSDEGEYDGMVDAKNALAAWRPLHAKTLLLEGSRATALAIGSFNFTRRGLGIHGSASNTEAGMVWTLPADSSSASDAAIAFAGPWCKVDAGQEGMVWTPDKIEGDTGQHWPAFIHAIRASREGLKIEGDGAGWPEELRISMRDIRARLVQQERDFDPWVIPRSQAGLAVAVTLPLLASWIEREGHQALADYPPLADLEVTLEWEGRHTVLPVVFTDKHEFPVAERVGREDERMLLDWFLGLRPADDVDVEGFGHGFDPSGTASAAEARADAEILSYLVRDFVHALPGIRAHLESGAATETGLRAALLGPRSPATLASEIVTSWKNPAPGKPRKSDVATAFQLVELRKVVERAALQELPDGLSERLRSQCVARIDAALNQVLGKLNASAEPALSAYLQTAARDIHAAA